MIPSLIPSFECVTRADPSPAGFSLVETLIAITILTMAIVGPYTLTQRVLEDSYLARDTLIASGLAQEGIETVRFFRDSNYLYKNRNSGTTYTWLAGVDGTDGQFGTGRDCLAPKACKFDFSLSAFPTIAAPCDGGVAGCGALYPQSDGRYTVAQGGATPIAKFYRALQLTTISATEVKVTVTVTWYEHGPHTVTQTEYIRDWL
jgi:hypothetical protein